jgi:hypothetical protein
MFIVDASTNSNFGTIAALLTDGFNDVIGLGEGTINSGVSGGGVGNTEQESFFPGGGGPDFAGHTIADLKVTLTSAQIIPGPPFLFPDGSEEFDFTYQIEVQDGVVPEPRMSWPLAIGAITFCIALGIVRRHRHTL